MENQINQVLLIKNFVMAAPRVAQALFQAESILLVKARGLCQHEALSRILNMIQEVIEPDATYKSLPLDLRNQRTYAVKSGISGFLDVARQAYKELTESVHMHVSDINGGVISLTAR